MTKASDNAFPSLLITEGTEPSAPAAGKQRLYIDSTTHVLMLTNSSGTESPVGGGAPTTADYLVGTANGSLSAEIVVGTTPGGELGGTWGTPTVDIVHAGATAWTNYTPTWAVSGGSPNLGSSTVTGRYKKIDTNTVIVYFALNVTTGGAWNAGSGNYSFSLPAGMTASAGNRQVIPGHILDSGTTHFVCSAAFAAGGTTTLELYAADGSGSKIVTNTVPMTPATGDIYEFMGTIEIQ